MVRIGREHREAPSRNIGAIEVRRRWWDTRIGIARITPPALPGLDRCLRRWLLRLAHHTLRSGEFVRVPIRLRRAAGPEAQAVRLSKDLGAPDLIDVLHVWRIREESRMPRALLRPRRSSRRKLMTEAQSDSLRPNRDQVNLHKAKGIEMDTGIHEHDMQF